MRTIYVFMASSLTLRPIYLHKNYLQIKIKRRPPHPWDGMQCLTFSLGGDEGRGKGGLGVATLMVSLENLYHRAR